MNALAVELLGVAKEYLGPAAPAFLSRELTALGVNANTVTSQYAQQDETREINTLQSMGIAVVTSSGNSYANAHGQGRNIRNGAGHDFQVWIGY